MRTIVQHEVLNSLFYSLFYFHFYFHFYFLFNSLLIFNSHFLKISSRSFGGNFSMA